MRNFKPKVCLRCGTEYIPNGAQQKYCENCKKENSLEKRRIAYRRKHPFVVPRNKTEKCCVCGKPFVSEYNGKPYCNKHYLRMYNNGTLDVKQRKRTCRYDICDETLKIITKKGEVILADAADIEKLHKYSWCVSATGYPVANIKGKVTKLHRYLLDLKDQEVVVDHINRNPLDNRRKNLRLCSQFENSRNLSISKNNKSGFVGISETSNGRYMARIMVNRKEIGLGTFDKKEDAVKARLQAEEKYFGKFAPKGRYKEEEDNDEN